MTGLVKFEAVGLFDAKATKTMQKARRLHACHARCTEISWEVKADVTRHRYGEPPCFGIAFLPRKHSCLRENEIETAKITV